MNGDYPIGTTVSSKLIGRKSNNLFVWLKCPICGKERWLSLGNLCRQKRDGYCWDCVRLNDEKRNWKGGKHKHPHGYILIWLQDKDFYYPMCSNKCPRSGGYILEHRLVMAKQVGRCLHSWEIVHHKNHIRDDNRIENLQLVSDDRHKQITLLENKITKLISRIDNQDKEIRLLKWQLKEQMKTPTS